MRRLVRARRPARSSATAKKAGSGFATPTAPEGRTKSRYGSSPSSATIATQVRSPVADDAERHSRCADRAQHRLDIGIELPGAGRELAGQDALQHLGRVSNAEVVEQRAVVAAPVGLDARVIGPGVVARAVVLVPEPSVRCLPRARRSSSVIARPSSEHARQRVHHRVAWREEREARVEAQQPVAHDRPNGSAPGGTDAPAGPLLRSPRDRTARPHPAPRPRRAARLVRADHRDFPWRGRPTRTPCWSARSCSSRRRPRGSPSDSSDSWNDSRTAESLAAAPTADVLAEWSGLGYNRRALALQASRGRREPRRLAATSRGLAALPGVGPYTARAVASLAFGRPVGVVDTNVRRWLLRRFGGPGQPRRLQDWPMRSPRRPAPTSPPGPTPRWSSARPSAGREPRAATPARSPAAARRAVGRPRSRSRASLPCAAPIARTAARSCGSCRRRAATHATSGRCAHGSRPTRGASVRRWTTAGWERVVAALERDGLVHRSRGAVRLGAARIGA